MTIDLRKVLSYIRGEITRQKVRAIASDLYPKENMWCNLLGNVVASGVMTEIQRHPIVTKAQFNTYVQRLVNGYDAREIYAQHAVLMWIDIYGRMAEKIDIKPLETEDNELVQLKKLEQQEKLERQSQQRKVVNSRTGSQYIEERNGDYKIRVLGNNNIEIMEFVGRSDAEIVIPDLIEGRKVIGIGSSAFADCSLIRKIIIPEGVQYLGRDVFYKCSSLKDIELPSTLCQLGSNVFSYTALNGINLPEKLTSLPDGAFRFCKYLKRAAIPASVNHIADYAFWGCTSLSDVTIKEGLEYMGDQIFDRCEQLNSILLPKSLKMITGTLKDHLWSKINPEPQPPEKFTIRCYSGSYAMTYAKAHGYHVEDVTAEAQ